MKAPQLAGITEYVRKNDHTARIVGVTALIVAMSGWTSCSALRTTKEARAEIAEARAARESATRFAQQFASASTGETDEWARTTAEAAEHGTPEALKVSLAQTVSRIAEVAGVSRAKASFSPADSLGAVEPRNIGDVSFQPATFGLRLEGRGSVTDVSRVILRLPPATEITSLSLKGDSEALQATFQLAVYQPAGGPQN